MSQRKEFRLTQQQLNELSKASQSVPYLVMGGMAPASPQENANRAWNTLGDQLGFVGSTVEPVASKGQLFFTAIEKPIIMTDTPATTTAPAPAAEENKTPETTKKRRTFASMEKKVTDQVAQLADELEQLRKDHASLEAQMGQKAAMIVALEDVLSAEE